MDLVLLLILILIVVLLWRGPRMLPRLGESLGQAVRGARRAADDSFESEPVPRSPRDDSGDPR